MYFGWFLTDWLSQVPANIAGAALKALKTVFFSLNTHIYKLIIDLYNMFIKLCTTRLLSSELLSQISNRIGLILGIVMLFFVTLSFIQMLLNPDAINDKEKGATSVIKKVIIVIVMFGSSNFFFQTLFDIQQLVIKSNLISKLLLPYSVTTTIGEYDNSNDTSSNNAVMDDTNFGGLLSEELFMSFYQLEEIDNGGGNDSFEIEEQEVYDACKSTIIGFRMQIVNYSRFDLGYNCLNEEVSVRYKADGNESDTQEMSIVDFKWPLATFCGIFVVYLLFMYCLKIGVRMVQLMFLEIISSMAFVSYLSPKKDAMFDKWKKIYFSTYVDVFIRIAIINFVFFLIATVFSNGGEEGLMFEGEGSGTFFNVVIILALLTFAKKAPELLKELLPASASKLGFGGVKMKDMFGVQRALGIAAGAAVGGTVGFLGGKGIGAFGGVFRGARAGFGAKGVGASFGAARKAQAEHNLAARQGQLPGFMDRLSTSLGASTTKERYDNQIERLELDIQNQKVATAAIRRRSAAYGQVSTAKGNIEDRAEKKLFSKTFAQGSTMGNVQESLLKARAQVETLKNSGASPDQIAAAETAYFSELDSAKKSYITFAMGDENFDKGMTAMIGDLKNTININADGAFDGMTFNTTSYDDLDAFEGSTTQRNTQLSRDIAVSDAQIQGIENQIQNIKNSPGYRDSHKIK